MDVDGHVYVHGGWWQARKMESDGIVVVMIGRLHLCIRQTIPLLSKGAWRGVDTVLRATTEDKARVLWWLASMRRCMHRFSARHGVYDGENRSAYWMIVGEG